MSSGGAGRSLARAPARRTGGRCRCRIGEHQAAPAVAGLRGRPEAAADGPETARRQCSRSLDPEQREVALAPRGPVCVLAGAGTGKTRAVAHRIAYLAATAQADPARVLAVTFTTRAAGELRGRLRQLGQLVPDAGLGQGAGPDLSLGRAAAAHPLLAGDGRRVRAAGPGIQDQPGRRGGAAAAVSAGLPELRDAAAEIEWAKVTQVRPDDYAGREREGRPHAAARRRRDGQALRRL